MTKKEKTFEESMSRLEEIVRELEQNDAPLEETIQMFEEGLKLVGDCDAKLKQYEKRINDILQKEGGDRDE